MRDWPRALMSLLKYLIVFVAALAAGMVAEVPVSTLGLIVTEIVVLPLTFGTGAIFAAVSALWTSNLLVRGRTQGRLVPVVGVCLPTAIIVSILNLTAPLLRDFFIAPWGLRMLLLGTIFVAFSSSIATWRFRQTGRDLRRDALLTLILLVLVPAVVIAVVFLTCSLGYCGA